MESGDFVKISFLDVAYHSSKNIHKKDPRYTYSNNVCALEKNELFQVPVWDARADAINNQADKGGHHIP